MHNGLVKFFSTLSLAVVAASVTGYSHPGVVTEQPRPDYVETYGRYLAVKDLLLAGQDLKIDDSEAPSLPEEVAAGVALTAIWSDLADFKNYGIQLKGSSEITDWLLQQQFMDAGERIQIVYFCNFVGNTDLIDQQGISVKGEGAATYVINQVVIKTSTELSVVLEEKVLGYSESCTK